MAKTTRFFRFTASCVCVAILFSAYAAEARPRPKASAYNPRYAMLIMDAQSGKILEEQNSHKQLPPASLTKMMTLFMAFEAVEQGKLRMDSNLVITQNAMRQAPSKLGLRKGEKITLRQAAHVLVTRSANDVAMAVAETVGGSEKNFGRMMTQRAHSLGMKDSYFYNPSGLPNPGQKSSAHDMAILARAIMQYFPQHYPIFKTIRFNYKGQNIETHNNLMRRFKGMDGMKTGYTVASGFNLVASAVRNNRRVIVVVFGGRSAASRDNHVADLMNRGLAQLTSGQPIKEVAIAKTPPKPPVTPPVVVSKTTVNTSNIRITPARNAAPAVAKAPAAVSTTTIETRTPTASADRAGWSPDGGAVKTLRAPSSAPTPSATASLQAVRPGQNWGVQIGAFKSAALGQQALHNVRGRLSGLGGQPIVVPSTTAQGVIYRARIIGMTSSNAARACQILAECMTFTMR